MKRLCALYLSLLAAAALGSAETAEPFVSYNHRGGLSPYSAITITVSASGAARVQIEKQKSDLILYDATLSDEELDGLREIA